MFAEVEFTEAFEMIFNACQRVLLSRVLIVCSLLHLSNAVLADGPADNRDDVVRVIPPPGIELGPEKEELLQLCRQVRSRWAELERTPRVVELESEVLVFPRAVELAIEFQQFYKKADISNARLLLELAETRMEAVQAGKSWRELVGLSSDSPQTLVVGGFRSAIDGSIQPYAAVVPAGISLHDQRKRRLDIWFHGRGEKESEAGFLSKRRRDAGIYQPADTIVLHPYGRYSNAFRFAGETDVFEALSYICERLPVDDDLISVRGFSMGGAACWQFATHFPDRWFAANPGAGFSETKGFLNFFQNEPVQETAPEYQKRMWKLYDNPPLAKNLKHCPLVVYSGEIDRQKQAADVMQVALDQQGINMVHVIGPNTAHKIHPDSRVEIEKRMDSIAQQAKRHGPPDAIAYTTYTARYPRTHWIHLNCLQQEWQKASIEAAIVDENIKVTTSNVSDFSIIFESGQWKGITDQAVEIAINGVFRRKVRPMSDRSLHAEFWLTSDGWQQRNPQSEDLKAVSLRKISGLQGPIDDAFTSPFVFVLPSSTSSNPKFDEWVSRESQHAMQHWRQHFRGDVVKVFDNELSKTDIANKNLILFGNEESNSVIAKIHDRLPIRTSEQTVGIGKASFPLDRVAVAMIYPNPLNPSRYVVLNSGFTYREYDYLNNARQTPKLPDWALIDIATDPTPRTPGKVLDAGFFDSNWK